MQLMLQCRDEVFLNLTSEEKKSFNYTELGKKAFEKIRIEGKNLGPIGKWAVDLSVLACNLGVCAGYMIFIASNLRVCYFNTCIVIWYYCNIIIIIILDYHWVYVNSLISLYLKIICYFIVSVHTIAFNFH